MSKQKLNYEFYRRYDENFIFNKVRAIWLVDGNPEKLKDLLKLSGLPEDDINDKFYESLRAEVYFSALHQFEALFALILASFQHLPHWLYMTTYTTREVKDKISSYLNNDISAVTDGAVANHNDFLNRAVYSGFISNEHEKQNKWNDNLANLTWVLQRMAKKYIDGSEYNAYKL